MSIAYIRKVLTLNKQNETHLYIYKNVMHVGLCGLRSARAAEYTNGISAERSEPSNECLVCNNLMVSLL